MLGAHQFSSASTLPRTINSVYDSFIDQLICWPHLFLRHNFGVSAPLRHYFCYHSLEGTSFVYGCHQIKEVCHRQLRCKNVLC